MRVLGLGKQVVTEFLQDGFTTEDVHMFAELSGFSLNMKNLALMSTITMA